jgi:uncharacterized DUF497 family protein
MQDDEFEWDDAKADANHRKHGLSFKVAIRVFSDTMIVEDFQIVDGEERIQAIGYAGETLVVVIYTEREYRRRIHLREARKEVGL